jgi:hypothetical protein
VRVGGYNCRTAGADEDDDTDFSVFVVVVSFRSVKLSSSPPRSSSPTPRKTRKTFLRKRPKVKKEKEEVFPMSR